MLCRTQVRATMVVAIAALAMLGACSDSGEELAGPPIPTLAGEASDSGIETVAGGEFDAQCACEAWSCTIGDCGYDPATDSRGACCVENVCGGTPVAKPSCDEDYVYCSQSGVGGEYGVDICLPGTEPYGYGCNVCPSEFPCCFGGHYGDPYGSFPAY